MKYDIYNPPIPCDLIVADPPWSYGSRGARSGRHGEPRDGWFVWGNEV